MTRFLYLQLHIAIKFEKSPVDGDGRAANADDTILHAQCCLRRRATECERQDRLTKTLPVQQTGCWVQELPEPDPPAVIGEHESPT